MGPNYVYDMLDVEDRYRYYPSAHQIAQVDAFDDLANHGRFDEEGGELSDQDWADSQ